MEETNDPIKDDIHIPSLSDTEALEIFRTTAFLHVSAKRTK